MKKYIQKSYIVLDHKLLFHYICFEKFIIRAPTVVCWCVLKGSLRGRPDHKDL